MSAVSELGARHDLLAGPGSGGAPDAGSGSGSGPAPGSAAAAPVRTMLVDDHTVLREGLRRSLEAAGLQVVAEAGDGSEVLEAARLSAPDVVLMDISLPGEDGIEVTRQLRRSMPEVAVVVLTMFGDASTVQAAREAGAVGYLVKDCSTAEIVASVHEAASGRAGRAGSAGGVGGAGAAGAGTGGLGHPVERIGPYLVRSAAASHGVLPGVPDEQTHALTRREVEVLEMLANGASTTEVAAKLYVSAKTVKNHLAHIYAKLGADSRTKAVAKAVRLGIVRIK